MYWQASNTKLYPNTQKYKLNFINYIYIFKQICTTTRLKSFVILVLIKIKTLFKLLETIKLMSGIYKLIVYYVVQKLERFLPYID